MLREKLAHKAEEKQRIESNNTKQRNDQWQLVVKLDGRAAKFYLWFNIWDCRPGCFYNIVAFPVTPAALILSNLKFSVVIIDT